MEVVTHRGGMGTHWLGSRTAEKGVRFLVNHKWKVSLQCDAVEKGKMPFWDVLTGVGWVRDGR